MIERRDSIRSVEVGKLANSTFPVSFGMLGIITPNSAGISTLYLAQTRLTTDLEA
jgi:hypothetical protein